MDENQQLIIDKNKELINQCVEKYNLRENPNIDNDLLLFKNFPQSVSLKLTFVILMYKREIENNELAQYSNQSAAVIRDLSKAGFIFEKNETGYNTYYNEDKKRVRKIISLVESTSSILSEDSQAISQIFINDISIKDFFCIQDLEIKNIAGNKEVYILGENGDGKSLLLQAIVLGLKGFFIENRANYKVNSIGHALQLIRDSETYIEVKSMAGHSFSVNGDTYVENIFAYGVNRGRKNAENSDEYGFGSLFGNEVYLKEPTTWLLDVDRLNARNLPSIKLDIAKEMVEELLDNNVKISIGKDVTFEERGTEIKFEQLSEGYRSVITWVIDLLARLSDNQTVDKIQDFKGIVLVDEIGLHLHPKWEYSIIKKLRNWFPEIQFIFTTHSPITILGASSDAVFYRIYKENGITKVDEPFYADKISNWMANIVITSPLFDLDSARMRAFDVKHEDLDTSQDFIYHLIHKEISKGVEEIKKTGKTHIPMDVIEKMIADAIEKHKV